ncbi:hypothetical protein [Streptomyces sp. 891-h]|uniref:hypothetical protein n=1 Tax=Streptomyces sp. 891-h TaxID=2720714 RepID=UPI001FA9738D|nr:hypothetical protein [Streptomyces sp. 891-h]UNZ16277.1 hypothetical protein HC362_03455 [Streptomyces sp. 891-h]
MSDCCAAGARCGDCDRDDRDIEASFPRASLLERWCSSDWPATAGLKPGEEGGETGGAGELTGLAVRLTGLTGGTLGLAGGLTGVDGGDGWVSAGEELRLCAGSAPGVFSGIFGGTIGTFGGTGGPGVCAAESPRAGATARATAWVTAFWGPGPDSCPEAWSDS